MSMRQVRRLIGSVVVVALVGAVFAQADFDTRMAAAEKWVDGEFAISAISHDEQMAEMEWFIKACEPYRGMKINSTAENIRTHFYESEVLTKAFEDICGISVTHDIIGEGDVVERLQTQMNSGENI